MNNSIIKQIAHEYEIKRNKAIEEAAIRKRELMAVNPRLQEIEDEIAKNSFEITKQLIVAGEKEKASLLQKLKKQNSALIKEKDSFIKNLSKDSNLFNPHFECKLCKDTGYIQKGGETVMCSCFKQRIFDIAYNKSNMGNLERENFSRFDLKVFSDKTDKEKYNSTVSPRENILLIKEKAETFINNFDDPEEKNLIFTGSTGTGKTFMINCISNELLKQGYTVLYQTAPVMFDEILNEKFNREGSFNIYENILNVDLLIIDDLGTENITDSKITELFTIINTRLLNQNHKITKTIISTNLNVDELFKTYTTRIGSRLAGYYRFLRFYGDDLRFTKSKKSKE